jgi:opacity protein-like surface antigen
MSSLDEAEEGREGTMFARRSASTSQAVTWLVFLGVWGLLHVSPPGARGELYVGGHLGPQISNNFGAVSTTGGTAEVGFSDLDLKNFLVFGAKTGYFLSQWPNLGLEVSASHAKPDIRAQSSVVTGPVPGVFAFDRTSLRVVTVAFNVIARAQMKGFEPYAGVGLGLFFAQLKDATGETRSENGVPGLNVVAGYRSFLTDDRRIAMAVEYNYQRATFSFRDVFDPGLGIGTGLRGDYEAHAVTVGLSYHFH